ncbi:MAG TPA: DUF5368 domain-containing protein [Roseomonas sp.]|nr:DUF5368 domain-containing protein [Roseomonas sp.]
MKELEIATFVAVFQELLGWTLWPIVAGCAIATLAFLYVLIRDRGVVAGRMLRAELLGVLGGAAAVTIMFAVTNSTPADLGGPIDWLLVAGIFGAGLVGGAIGSYALMGLFARAPSPQGVPRARPAKAA